MATVVTNAGRAVVTNRIKGAGTEPLNAGWGTGAGTAAVADTTLFTEVLVSGSAGGTDHTAGTSTQQTTTVTSDTYQVVATRTATGSVAVTNMGLFDAASGGTLFLKGDFSVINLVSGDSIQATFKAIFA
jgi:hypothetical protein